MRMFGGWRENEMHGCSTGKQTRFDMDIPYSWPYLKEMLEIIGSRSNFSLLFLVYLLKLEWLKFNSFELVNMMWGKPCTDTVVEISWLQLFTFTSVKSRMSTSIFTRLFFTQVFIPLPEYRIFLLSKNVLVKYRMFFWHIWLFVKQHVMLGDTDNDLVRHCSYHCLGNECEVLSAQPSWLVDAFVGSK